jgi:hypothetical protein
VIFKHSVGNNYGLRTWIEYGFKQAKDELGWADYRVTDYQSIEKWWEIVCSAYLMVSLQSKIFKGADEPKQVTSTLDKLERQFRQHQWWDKGQGSGLKQISSPNKAQTSFIS